MKELNQSMKSGVAQGEILLLPVDAIPAEFTQQNDDGGYHILAHSETGHHHRVLSRSVNFFVSPVDPLTAYIDVSADVLLDHMRSFDTHEAYNIKAGKYMIRTARESSPDGWQRVAD